MICGLFLVVSLVDLNQSGMGMPFWKALPIDCLLGRFSGRLFIYHATQTQESFFLGHAVLAECPKRDA